MEPRRRRRFNAAFSQQVYPAYVARLEQSLGCEVGFRLAETPVFLPEKFRSRCEVAAREIVDQLSEPRRIARMRGSLPKRWTFAGETALPTCAVVDFAAVREPDGTFAPRLVELQGFPSLFAFEVMQHDAWADTLAGLDGLDLEWTCWFGGRTRETFLDAFRGTVVGASDPENVVLLDVEPERQKTYADFLATKRLLGVEPLDPRALVKRGRTLLRRDERGREIAVERIYHRFIVDELEARAVELPFDPHDDLDVVWTPHPNWFFIWSKSSLPFLDHPAIPATRLLDEWDPLPDDLETRYVLKPLFSFAGAGVNLHPTKRHVAAIPEHERHSWCLQEKIEYGPAIAAADGGEVKLEIRLMFLRPDGAPRLELMTNLCRLSRGPMLGVDFNKNMTWVGSSVGLWPAE